MCLPCRGLHCLPVANLENKGPDRLPQPVYSSQCLVPGSCSLSLSCAFPLPACVCAATRGSDALAKADEEEMTGLREGRRES